MKKTIKVILICVIIIALIVIIAFAFSRKNEQSPEKTLTQAKGITVVPTMRDTITGDSSWCGTFQLVWNDMKNEVVKKDIIFNPQEEMVENLNKEEFTKDMISEDYYFKKYGLKTKELKQEIEDGIKKKFNQRSELLDDFDWSDEELDDASNYDIRRYFFYVMLYRKFEFLKEFDKLDDGKFANKYDNIGYFGIDKETEEDVGNQIDVLYYKSQDDFALIVNTKTDDEVIFCKNPLGSNFNEIYENMNSETSNYTGSQEFQNVDEFKAPNLLFNIEKEFKELQNKQFGTADPIYDTAEIEKAIQTINFSLNEKGGEIKSEAGIAMKMSLTAANDTTEPRYFYVDDTFSIFLREKGKEKPYFAARIEDITKFQ